MATTVRLPSEVGLPYVSMSDAALIADIAAGDKVAMRVLYARHSLRVFRFALRLLDSKTAAEDVVIEVFFAVWRDADRFEGHSQVVTWILAIARHKAIDLRRQRQTEHLDEDAAMLIEGLSDNPEEAIHKRETNSIVRHCLVQLSPKHREIVDLVYYRGQSIDEVAKLIGVVRNTVKTRIHYARKQLIGLLAAHGVDTSLA
jgi:RNA polymerase sigma-70 factor (ECF subfamily)